MHCAYEIHLDNLVIRTPSTALVDDRESALRTEYLLSRHECVLVLLMCWFC